MSKQEALNLKQASERLRAIAVEIAISQLMPKDKRIEKLKQVVEELKQIAKTLEEAT